MNEEFSLYLHSVLLVNLLPGYLRSFLDPHFATLLGVRSCQDTSHIMSTPFFKHSEKFLLVKEPDTFFFFSGRDL